MDLVEQTVQAREHPGRRGEIQLTHCTFFNKIKYGYNSKNNHSMSYNYKPSFWNMPSQQQPRYQRVRFHTNSRLCGLTANAPVGNSYSTLEECVQQSTNSCGQETYGCGDSGCYITTLGTTSPSKESCHKGCTNDWGWKCGPDGTNIQDIDSKVAQQDLRCYGCANKDISKASNVADMGPDGSCTYTPGPGTDALNYLSEADCKTSEVTKCGWMYSCAS